MGRHFARRLAQLEPVRRHYEELQLEVRPTSNAGARDIRDRRTCGQSSPAPLPTTCPGRLTSADSCFPTGSGVGNRVLPQKTSLSCPCNLSSPLTPLPPATIPSGRRWASACEAPRWLLVFLCEGLDALPLDAVGLAWSHREARPVDTDALAARAQVDAGQHSRASLHVSLCNYLCHRRGKPSAATIPEPLWPVIQFIAVMALLAHLPLLCGPSH